MSVVLAVATQERIIVKSDGRERDADTRQIISEDLHKFAKVSLNCIVGYTGTKYVGQQITDEIIRVIPENAKIEPDSVAKLIQRICQNNLKECYGCAFVVAGISYQLQKPILYGVSYTDNFLNINNSFYQNNIPGSIFIGSEWINKTEFIMNNERSLESNMNDYIKLIAANDDCVNDHISTIKLRM